jgi:hypothetical protein
MAATRKTASGVRKSVFVPIVLFVAGVVFLALLGKVSVATGTAILLGSAVLGPVLIWLAYRRWCNAEVD